MQLSDNEITMTVEEFIRYHTSAKVRVEMNRANRPKLERMAKALPGPGAGFLAAFDANQEMLSDQVAEGDRLVAEFLGNEVAR